MTPRTPDGLWSYLGSGDVAEVARYGARSETIDKLLRAGCVGALPMIESVEGTRQPLARVVDVVGALAEAHLSAILASFPSILGSLSRSFAHMAAVRDATGCAVQWDVEPKHVEGRAVHWTQRALDVALEAEPGASITSTRLELPRLDVRGREVWLQLEQQTSTATIADVLGRWPTAICITGVFDQRGDPRTLDEVRRDLERCRGQAVRTGKHGVWSARSMSGPECDVLRTWALATWPAPTRPGSTPPAPRPALGGAPIGPPQSDDPSAPRPPR